MFFDLNLLLGESIIISYVIIYVCDCFNCEIQGVYNYFVIVLSIIDNCGDSFLCGVFINEVEYDVFICGFVEGFVNIFLGDKVIYMWNVISI